MGGQRRQSQVFVEIPSSATTSYYQPHVSSSRKENALRASVSQNTIMSTNTSSKRKQDETHDQPSKKAKVEITSIKPNATRRPLANATPDFPNGFVYCHQCNKKRDAAITVHCTFQDAKSNRRCVAKYCAPCLKNRYGIALQDVLSTSTVPPDQKKRHVSGEGYFFKCPRCEETCNCVHCRKAKGLAPTGNLTLAARNSGLLSAADVLLHDPTAAGPMAGKAVTEKKPRARKPAPQPTSIAADKSKSKLAKKTSHIPTHAPPPTPKPLPKALWTPIRTHLSLHGAEARIHIREFALRFLPLSRAHFDELEIISRSHRGFNEDDDEDGDLESWVSEGCLKSLLIALLGMMEVDAKTLSTTTSALHHHWFLPKIVEALSTFSTLSSLPLPPPAPAPEHLLQSMPIIRTRSSRTSSHPQTSKQTSKETDWPEVVRTSQLIPVIIALVDQAVQGQAVRDALEDGVKEAKELTKESIETKKALERTEKDKKEREKAEKEQTSKVKKGKDKVKGKGSAHAKGKDVTAVVGEPMHTLTPKTALTIALSSYAQRIAPLGQDTEGRVYWALTPGRGERDASCEYLTSNVEVEQQDEGSKAKSKTTKSKSAWTPPSLAERTSHKRWSWFVAVWGVRPRVEERRDPPKDEDDSEDNSSESESGHDSDADEDEDQENKIKPERPGWYAFSDPAEIFKLAEWLDRKAGLESRFTSSGKSKLRPISALPSRAASALTSRAVSAPNTRTSASTSRAASSSHKFKATHTSSKLSISLLTDVEVVSSSEVEDSEEESDSDANEHKATDEDQNIENDDMAVDSPLELDDTPRTSQLRSLVRELRAYAELLKKRA
ncbi:hypothetical protein K503DRAFT_181435 [Rhizopogon vinicolor AM-OR11-026]|uniref:Zinc-finger domain-containing protein n=1 Tax=Rhizopogon vinicolor AM-OR11-026 TaxID=1314800 RepID=A0A1B7NEG6_9AGAM|nr:hypothetical protein K503DRAFT_181435 [Rhizopogon vinicolor AM-OR11-026]